MELIDVGLAWDAMRAFCSRITGIPPADLTLKALEEFEPKTVAVKLAEWLTIAEFKKRPVGGLCWIQYREYVLPAWYMRGEFYHSEYGKTYLWPDRITDVAQIPMPERADKGGT